MHIKRRFVISVLFTLPFIQAEAQTTGVASEAELAKISGYLDSIKSMKARFVQISSEGAKSSGTMMLSRPGKIRFQYDAPSPYLLVAGFGEVTFYDKELNQTTKVQTSSTPLGILLESHINFGSQDDKTNRDIKVSSITRANGQIFLKLFRPKEADEGFITLILNQEPMKLLGWVVTDKQRQNTRVDISNIELDVKFSDDLFRFEDPRFKNNRNN